MSEKWFLGKLMENKKNDKNEQKNPENQNPIEISRREFIKKGIYAATGIIWLSNAVGIGELIRRELKKHDDEEKENQTNEIKQEPTEEQKEIEEDDVDVAGKTVEQQIMENGEVTLNLKTKEALYKKWFESYSLDGKNYPGLEKALQRMRPWIAQLKEIFKQEGVPKDYVFLAIPESHFNIKAISRAKACGSYQFTLKTARSYGLRIADNFDERYDPIESARACARCLKESYEIFNHDWRLALADYNGSYTNKYAKFRENKEDRNYEDYLKWREKRLNDFLYFEYDIAANDNLTIISAKFKIKKEDIKKINKLTGEKLLLGQKLKIPKDVSKAIDELRSSLENLNYPEKFFAVLDVIKKNNLEEKFPPNPIKYDLTEVPKIKFSRFNYRMKKGDTLFSVAHKIKSKFSSLAGSVSLIIERLKKENNISNTKGMRAGINIGLDIPVEKSMTLAELAAKKRISVEKLADINPAVTEKSRELPPGIKIRLPKT